MRFVGFLNELKEFQKSRWQYPSEAYNNTCASAKGAAKRLKKLRKTFKKLLTSKGEMRIILNVPRQTEREPWKQHSVEIESKRSLSWSPKIQRRSTKNTICNLVDDILVQFRKTIISQSEKRTQDVQNEFNSSNLILTRESWDNIFLRVWSWLRMNAGGVPNTCKSSGKLLIETSVDWCRG